METHSGMKNVPWMCLYESERVITAFDQREVRSREGLVALSSGHLLPCSPAAKVLGPASSVYLECDLQDNSESQGIERVVIDILSSSSAC